MKHNVCYDWNQHCYDCFTLGDLCDDSVMKLKKWASQIDDSEHKILAHEGENEMLELAERYQNRFPEVLSEKYSNNSYKVTVFHNFCSIKHYK